MDKTKTIPFLERWPRSRFNTEAPPVSLHVIGNARIYCEDCGSVIKEDPVHVLHGSPMCLHCFLTTGADTVGLVWGVR